MLRSILASCPQNSEIFRWLRQLAEAWDNNINYYTFWFRGTGMPRRNYCIPTSHRGQKKVVRMALEAIRSLQRHEPIYLDKMEEGLAEAFELMRRTSHYSRLDINEALPFIEFLIGLLESVWIYGLELTSSGKEAVDYLKWVSQDMEYRMGSLLKVEELLEDLDKQIDGKLICDVDGSSSIEAGCSSSESEWINFYPEMIPFSVTLNLDCYVRPACSKEEWAENETTLSDWEAGYQCIEPSNHTRPSPGINTEAITGQSDDWSSRACCSEATTLVDAVLREI